MNFGVIYSYSPDDSDENKLLEVTQSPGDSIYNLTAKLFVMFVY